MSTQGQGDVVGQLERPHAVSILSMSKEALGASLNSAWDEIERLRALLSSSRGEQGWRTIDSAPKDGTRFLAWGPLWRCPFPAQFPDPVTTMVWIDTCEVEAKGRREYATHWMPLPSAPGSGPTSDEALAWAKEQASIVESGGAGALKPFEELKAKVKGAAAPQPTAGGDAPTEWTEGVCEDGAAILRDGQAVSISDLLAILNRENGALSAERARVIEECAMVADNYGREGDRLSKEYACEMADELAARIRALAQQDTGGADHG